MGRVALPRGRPWAPDVCPVALDLVKRAWPWARRPANGSGQRSRPRFVRLWRQGRAPTCGVHRQILRQTNGLPRAGPEALFQVQGIVVPEVQYWRLPNCTNMLHAVHADFRAVEGHTMEGLITWCNNALGAGYLATAPGAPVPLECPF